MRCDVSVSASVLTLAVPLAAQSFVVSPAFFASGEGNAAHDLLGWRTEYRYQQSHSDLKTQALLLKGLALRRDGGADNQTAVGRSIDAELVMSDGPGAAFSDNFAANYASPPQVVATRKSFVLPDLRLSVGWGAPFSVQFAFDAPFAHGLGKDALWELRVFQATATGLYVCDAYEDAAGIDFPIARSGVGCVANLMPQPMSATAAVRLNGQQLSVQLWSTYQPRFGWGAWLLSANKTSLQVPGWCAPVLVQPDLVLPASGIPDYLVLTLPPIAYPPQLTGQQVHAQMLAHDSLYAQNNLILSDAVTVTFAPLLQPGLVARIFSPGVNTTLGFGLQLGGGVIVRFAY